MRDLRRCGLWGLAAVGALTVAVYAATTPPGDERLASAISQTREMVALSDGKALRPLDAREGQRLAETVRTLTADRDRLQTRLTTLERRLGDITAQVATAQVATAQVARVEKAAQATTEQAAVAQPADDVTASIQPPVTQTAPAKAEFGLDLGSANTIDGLRVLWATARQRHSTLLEGLRPAVHLRERSRAGGIDMRLVAGPIPNAATAARMCATLVAAGAICQPSAYDGQRLAVR
jgi:hypothetical protein